MSTQVPRRRRILPFALIVPIVLLGIATLPLLAGASGTRADEKPNLSLRATPTVAFSPARISLLGELRGGADDYEEFYCASVEWDWGDGTRSESTYDCEPYESGKSEIRRRFATQHVYHTAGNYQIYIRLKQNDRVVTAANVRVQVRPGIRDGSPF